MPTVILLDNSLSMYRQLYNNDSNFSFKDISCKIISAIIENFNFEKSEFISLVTFSSTAEILCEFTRDYDKLLKKLNDLKVGDYPCLEEAFNLTSNLVIEEWGCSTNVQVILITNNIDTLHSSSVKNICHRLKENRVLLKDYYLSTGIDFDEKIHINPLLNEDVTKSVFYTNYVNSNKTPYFNCKFPFSFPNKFDIICLNSEKDTSFNRCINLYGFEDETFKVKKYINKIQSKSFYLNQLIELSNSSGKLHLTNNLESDNNIDNNFICKIISEIYNQPNYKLKFGHLESVISLSPSPLPFKGYQNNCYVVKEISKNLDIFSFISLNDLTIAPIINRHIIIPNELYEKEKAANREEIQAEYEKKQNGSFAYLLNSTFKTENVAGIASLGDEWYGAVHCMLDAKNDPKKRLNLILSVFTPGNESLANIVMKSNGQQSRPTSIKSYSKNCIIWYRSNNLVSDLQKIIRNAKKMQEKMPLFYKELNRARKAALSFGFYELFEGLALLLEKELTNIATTQSNANPETILQLSHCIGCLRSNEYKDFRKDIQPFVNNNPNLFRKM